MIGPQKIRHYVKSKKRDKSTVNMKVCYKLTVLTVNMIVISEKITYKIRRTNANIYKQNKKLFRPTNPCDWPAENPPLCEVYRKKLTYSKHDGNL